MKKNNYTIIPVFNKTRVGEWKKLKDNCSYEEDILRIIPREFQKRLLEETEEHRFVLYNAIPGLGKTNLGLFRTIDFVCRKKNGITVIVVPTLLIGDGYFCKGKDKYAKRIFTGIDGKEHEFRISPENDLTSDDIDGSKIDYFIDFLKTGRNRKNANDRVCIIAAASFVMAFQRMIDNGEIFPYKDILYVIDEYHHVRGANELFDEENNRLGNVVNYILDKNDISTEMIGMTATPFRGDGMGIFSKTNFNKFKISKIKWDEAFDNFQYIKSLSLLYGFYSGKNQYESIVEHILRLYPEDAPVLFFLPEKGRHGNYEGKSITFDRIKKIVKRVRKTIKDEQIIDMLNVEGRRDKKTKINKKELTPNIIVSCRTYDEGTDWPDAAIAIDLAPSDSMVKKIQRIGRLLRDEPGKCDLYYYKIYRWDNQEKDQEKIRVLVDSNVKSIVFAMLLDELFNPLEMHKEPSGKTGEKKEKEVNYFSELNDDVKHNILEDVINLVLQYETDINNGQKKKTTEEIKKDITEIVKKNGVNENLEDVVKGVITSFIRYKKKIDAFSKDVNPNVPEIDYTMAEVIESFSEGFINYFFGKKITGKTLREILSIWESEYNKLEDWLKITEKEFIEHKKQNKPLTRKFMCEKYSGWKRCFQEYREQFEKFNIIIDKGNILEDWLEITNKEYMKHKKQNKQLTHKFMLDKYGGGWRKCFIDNISKFEKFNIIIDKGNILEDWLNITNQEYQKHKKKNKQLTYKFMRDKYGGGWQKCYDINKNRFEKFNIITKKGNSLEDWLNITEKEYQEHKKKNKPLTYKFMRDKYMGWQDFYDSNRNKFEKFNLVKGKIYLEDWLKITEKEYQEHKKQNKLLTLKFMVEKYGNGWYHGFYRNEKKFERFGIVKLRNRKLSRKASK